MKPRAFGFTSYPCEAFGCRVGGVGLLVNKAETASSAAKFTKISILHGKLFKMRIPFSFLRPLCGAMTCWQRKDHEFQKSTMASKLLAGCTSFRFKAVLATCWPGSLFVSPPRSAVADDPGWIAPLMRDSSGSYVTWQRRQHSMIFMPKGHPQQQAAELREGVLTVLRSI